MLFVAVVSGDTALRWIFNHTGNRTIIVLIDVDETYGHAGDSTGPIYTPPASPSDREEDSLEPSASGPYGLALLRVIAHYAAIGVFRNVAPIVSDHPMIGVDLCYGWRKASIWAGAADPPSPLHASTVRIHAVSV
ncbi:hypothetical protein GGI12_000184 [Dipsacomyces acuminosporus]|nr:hypothetical protein GGI12_000184 [Dipsacomyces acuminosporus]